MAAKITHKILALCFSCFTLSACSYFQDYFSEGQADRAIRKYLEEVESLGIFAVYPPRTNLVPGSVWFVANFEDHPNPVVVDAGRFFDQTDITSTWDRKFSLGRELEEITPPGGGAPTLAGAPIPNIGDAENNLFERVVFPTITVRSGSGIGAGLPGSGSAIGAKLTPFGGKYQTIKFENVHMASLDKQYRDALFREAQVVALPGNESLPGLRSLEEETSATLEIHSDNWRYRMARLGAEVIGNSRENRKIHDCKLIYITHVYYSDKIGYSSELTKTVSASATKASLGDLPDNVTVNLQLPGEPGDETQEGIVKVINELGAASEGEDGLNDGLVTLTDGQRSSVTFTQALPNFVAIGYGGISIDLTVVRPTSSTKNEDAQEPSPPTYFGEDCAHLNDWELFERLILAPKTNSVNK